MEWGQPEELQANTARLTKMAQQHTTVMLNEDFDWTVIHRRLQLSHKMQVHLPGHHHQPLHQKGQLANHH